MVKYFKIANLLTVVFMICFFSCAGKGGKAVSSKDKDKITEENLSAEQKAGAQSQTDEALNAEKLSANALERIYFDYDDANLNPQARETLKKDFDILTKNSNISVSLEGHCDERGSEEYNLALGERRADSIKKYLLNLGLSTKRMTTISYGKEKPLVIGHNEDAWSKNRRGELVTK